MMLVGSGTYAFYSDNLQTQSNQIEAGVIDMILTNTEENPSAQWVIEKGTPGDTHFNGGTYTYDSGHVRIHNCGNVKGDHVELSFNTIGYEDDDGDLDNGFIPVGEEPQPSPDTVYGPGDMSRSLRINELRYEVYPSGEEIDIVRNGFLVPASSSYFAYSDNGNGYVDLDDLSVGLDNLPVPDLCDGGAVDNNHYSMFTMEIALIDTGENQNEFQGDAIDLTVVATINQHSSQ